MTWYYNLIIALGGIIIGVFGLTDEIAKKIKLFQSLNSLTFKFLVYILGIVLIILGTILQANENDQITETEKQTHLLEIKNMDSSYRSEKRNSDSLYQERLQDALDSSYTRSIKSSNEALAKYNLVLIDSLNKVTNKINIKTFMPQLTIHPAEPGIIPISLLSENNRIHLDMKFKTANATSYRIKAACYIFKSTQKIDLLDYQMIFDGSKFIIPDINTTTTIYLSDDTGAESMLLIVFLGEFSKDADGESKIPYQQAVWFETKTNKTTGAGFINFKEITNYLKSKKIYFDQL